MARCSTCCAVQNALDTLKRYCSKAATGTRASGGKSLQRVPYSLACLRRLRALRQLLMSPHQTHSPQRLRRLRRLRCQGVWGKPRRRKSPRKRPQEAPMTADLFGLEQPGPRILDRKEAAALLVVWPRDCRDVRRELQAQEGKT